MLRTGPCYFGGALTVLAIAGVLPVTSTSLNFGQEAGTPAATEIDPDAVLTDVEVDATAAERAAPATKGYLGSGGCVQCHQGLSRALNNDAFIPLTEPEVWLTDPHSKAFEFIDWSPPDDGTALSASQQLSQEICRKLAIPDIHRAKQCLSCHANWIAAADQPPPIYELGVACESCHGPSAAWDGPHRNRAWRTRSVEEKARLGMVDVRNPVRRAEQCFSCHIGNVREGKLVTHAMYAAGHPPLPSIEIESFARQMPRHWRYLHEKVEDHRRKAEGESPDAAPFEFFAEFVQQNHSYLTAADRAERKQLAGRHRHGAAAVVLGGAVALREALELTGELASQGNDRAWPELAAFDCTACHHDLKQSVPPPTSQPRLRPGRPMIHGWPNALVQLAIFHVSTDAAGYQRKSSELDELLGAIHENLASTPFGDADRLRQETRRLSQWLTSELIIPVAAKPFDDQAVRLAAARLAHIGSQGTHDYDSARQIAWALRTIYCDLSRKPAADGSIQPLLQQLAADLRLDLPNSGGTPCEMSSGSVLQGDPSVTSAPIALTASVPIGLATEVQYDADRFRATMRQFGQLLNRETVQE